MVVRAGAMAKRYIFDTIANISHIRKGRPMSDLRRLCPNLAALRAFEAAARHGNFSRAAEEFT